MKHLYKCFNHCHNKVLYTFIAMIYLNMYFGKYFNAYAAVIKNRKRTSNEEDSNESNQTEDSEIFTCHSRGTFENIHNHNSYWYCDMTPDGGYVAIRRSCPNGQTFDTTKKKCASPVYARKLGCLNVHKFHKTPEPKISYVFIVPETTTTTTTTECSEETETEEETEDCTTTSDDCTETTTFPPVPTTICPSPPPLPPPPINTTCSLPKYINKFTTECPTTSRIVFRCDCEGAFPDPESCRTFYICHKKLKSTNAYEKIKVRCPEGMAFDFKLGWCSPQAVATCKTIKPSELSRFLRLVNLDGIKYARSLYRQRPRDRSINSNFLRMLRESRQHSIPILPIHLIKKRHIESSTHLFDDLERDSNSEQTFQCSAKGRFPNPSNHDEYYICYPKALGGYLTLKMKCPKKTSFDVNHLTCIPNNSKSVTF